MHDSLGEEIVELSIVTALRGGCVDLEQRVGFSTAHGFIGHSYCGQDTRAPIYTPVNLGRERMLCFVFCVVHSCNILLPFGYEPPILMGRKPKEPGRRQLRLSSQEKLAAIDKATR